jgi:hypothetical protein
MLNKCSKTLSEYDYIITQDDPQPVAAAHGMLHVPLPGPQQTAPLTKTTQAHVVQQPVPV